MALTDWKKIGKTEWVLKGATTIRLYIGKLTKTLLQGEQYYIQGENTQDVFRTKFFKTKLQALKFAKSYMKKH